MKINPDSSIQLDEGEIFVKEEQDESNIWRHIWLLMPSGALVKVWRHFSQIGPLIFRPDGTRIVTHLDRETGTVVEWKDAVGNA